jgi:hypothetical protein
MAAEVESTDAMARDVGGSKRLITLNSVQLLLSTVRIRTFAQDLKQHIRVFLTIFAVAFLKLEVQWSLFPLVLPLNAVHEYPCRSAASDANEERPL